MAGVGFGLLDVGVLCGEPAAASDDHELNTPRSVRIIINRIQSTSRTNVFDQTTYLAIVFLMAGSMLLLNAFAIFGFWSLIGICGGNAGGGVLFLSCCGINSSSMGFGRNAPTPKFGVVTPLLVDCIELFKLLLLLLLLIGAVALTELFICIGGMFPDDVVKPGIKPNQSDAINGQSLRRIVFEKRTCSKYHVGPMTLVSNPM